MRIVTLLGILLLVNVLPLKAVRPVATENNAGAIGYRMTRVRGKKKLMFPRLTRFRDRAVLNKVNRQIDAQTREFGCEGRGRDAYYNLRSRVEYAEKDVFSIYASAEYYCGGPYPTNDMNVSQTYDLRTGNQIKFEELFKNYEADKAEILKVIFAAQIQRAGRAAAGRPNAEQDCATTDPELFSIERLASSSYAFNFSKTGLSVQPEWPHAIEACADRVTVPYSKLARFAAPDGPLARVTR